MASADTPSPQVQITCWLEDVSDNEDVGLEQLSMALSEIGTLAYDSKKSVSSNLGTTPHLLPLPILEIVRLILIHQVNFNSFRFKTY